MTIATNPNFVGFFRENTVLQINEYQVKILSYLGQFADIFYYQVELKSQTENNTEKQLQYAILRIGSDQGGLARELKFREVLQDYAMISNLLTSQEIESIDNIIVALPELLENQEIAEKTAAITGELSEGEDNIYPEDNLGNQSLTNEQNQEITSENKDNNSEETHQENLTTLVNENEDKNSEQINQENLTDIASENEQNNLENESNDILINQELGENLTNKEALTSDKSETTDYLEEETFAIDTLDFNPDNQGKKLVLLNEISPENSNLNDWLNQEQPLEQILLIASQICQFFKYSYQREWCITSILPQFILVNNTLKISDLTGAYPLKDIPTHLWLNDYSAPELHIGETLHETMSTYTLGVILYQALHHQLLPQNHNLYTDSDDFQLQIKPIPKLSQIIKIALADNPQDRFPLSQLLQILIKTRQSLHPQIHWEIAHRSTVGLCLDRLQNEDNYGIVYPISSIQQPLILAGIADGMGGMSQGEIASQLAISSLLNANLNADFSTAEMRNKILVSIINNGNSAVIDNAKKSGTTLSIILAVGQELNIAHVGDSRIYLLRNNEIKQLTEDHSLSAMLFKSGQITYEESLTHPDRNVLLKSLGSSRQLNEGYIQTLKQTLHLEDQDIILLCSDGVWDLVNTEQLTTIFTSDQPLQEKVNQTLEEVINQGANDNATLIALQYHINYNIIQSL